LGMANVTSPEFMGRAIVVVATDLDNARRNRVTRIKWWPHWDKNMNAELPFFVMGSGRSPATGDDEEAESSDREHLVLFVKEKSMADDAGPPTKKQKKMMLKKKQQNVTTFDDDDNDLLDPNIASFLQLDHAMSRAGDEKQHRAERVVVSTSKNKKGGLEGGLGNSRSSSSAMHQAKPLPTLNKRRIQNERKEKQLLKIAKLLKKTKKELAKTAGTSIKKTKKKKTTL
jgi:hypothetical protein